MKGCDCLQRSFDIFLSLTALIVFLPFFMAIMLTLKFTGEKEIFFLQERVGKDGKRFKLLKFATMLKNSPNIGAGTITVKNDPRILPFGKFLRKTKINELPQLLNVLLGDMSLVGPRPQTIRCFSAFPKHLQSEIILVKPGLSGIGSIIFRGEENILDQNENSDVFYDNVIAPYKGEVELWYVKNYNIRTYLKLIFITVWIVCVPTSKLVWAVFGDLPKPPRDLKFLQQ